MEYCRKIPLSGPRRSNIPILHAGPILSSAGTRATVIASLLTVLAWSSPADTIHLANGRALEGIVQQETESTLVLSLGIGTITLKKSTIQRIERSTPEEKQALEDSWRKKNITHKKYTPREYQALSDQYRGVLGLRQAAVRANRERIAVRDTERTLDTELEALQQELLDASRRLKALDKDKESRIDEYNTVVKQVNRITAEQVIVRDELAQSREALTKQPASVRTYIDAVYDLRRAFGRQATDPARQAHPEFFDAMAARIQALENDFSSCDIPLHRARGGIVVAAVLNDHVTGRFLLDTGASMMTVSTEAANRLGLDLDAARKTRAILADGSEVPAQMALLASVQVGDARAEGVQIMVFDRKPGAQLDGLLGMSFLREFLVTVDAERGRVVLRKLKAE